jgi:hypothetical protein
MDALIISYKELLQRDDNNIKGVPRHSKDIVPNARV